MNIIPSTAPALEHALASQLRKLLGTISWLKGWTVERYPATTDTGFDLRVKIPSSGKAKLEWAVLCKAEPRPSQFPYTSLKNPAKHPRVPVLAAPVISPRMAALCEEHGWSWFDLAGNCRLSAPGMFELQHLGHPPVRQRARTAASLASFEAARIVRVLLAPQNAGLRWTHQALSNACAPEVSIGLVNKIARHLRDERYLEYLPLPEEGFVLRDPPGLLQAWRDVYRFDRHERRSYFTLLQGKPLQAVLAHLDSQTKGHAAYAAFSAADFQAPHVRQPKTWLYIRAHDLALFERLTEAKPVASGENVVVLIPADEAVFHLAELADKGQQRMRCTHPVQTYIDLSHAGGRGVEAAEALLEKNLMPAWQRRASAL